MNWACVQVSLRLGSTKKKKRSKRGRAASTWKQLNGRDLAGKGATNVTPLQKGKRQRRFNGLPPGAEKERNERGKSTGE